jgi:cytochrome b6-f complex iron-sulfur subunit
MAAFAKVSTGTLIVIIVAALIGLAGLGMMMVNIAALFRAKKEGPRSHRPIVGRPQQLPRRGFLGRMLGFGFSIALLDFGVVTVGFLWPNLKGGFGAKITLPQSAADILKQIRDTRQPFFNPNGRFYLVPYPHSDDPNNPYVKAGVTAGGLMALYQRCVHLGCRVPYCITSQWFECPCHGSKYNRAGEYKLGPAPRGLDRMVMEISGAGIVTVDSGNIVTGPPRGTNTTGQEKEGAFCV